jgi:hypothetical protein
MDDSVKSANHKQLYWRRSLGAMLVSIVFILVLCALFELRWETNDDVSMSMFAHGYGVATYGSPNLIFSNVVWGYVVRLIPEINGILGYSTATLGVLAIIGAVVTYGLISQGLGYIGGISALVLILARPVLFPQFTINAGLLMVAAMICWNLYERQKDIWVLVTGCFLAFFSYLVRSHEFLLVFTIALPLLPWRSLKSQRILQIAVAGLAVAIALSAVADWYAYQGPEWKAFNELNPARAPFTDYGFGEYLKQRPEILNQFGYSANDIDLIRNWFFVDPKIANSDNLNAMIEELGPLPTRTDLLNNAWIGVKTLWHTNLIPFFVAAILLAMFLPSWRIVAVWSLCIAVVFVMGLLGRPGVLRVYIPLVSLLLVAPLFAQGTGLREHGNWRYRLALIVIIVAAVDNTIVVFSASKSTQAASEEIRQGLSGFPTFPVVIWGGGFPYEATYPILRTTQSAMSYQLYGMGVSLLAPFSVAMTEEKNGSGFTDLLVQEGGIPIIARKQDFQLLGVYCKQHLDGFLKELKNQQFGSVLVSWRQCEVIP